MVKSSLVAVVIALYAASTFAQTTPAPAIDPTFFPKLPSKKKLVWIDCYATSHSPYSAAGYSAANTNTIILAVPNFAPLYPNYDIIGIDRRGTDYTTPTLKCFRNNEERNAWVAYKPPVLGSKSSALAAHRERARKFARQCEQLSSGARKWMGTYPSAVDVHTVMKAIGESKIYWHALSSGTHTAHTIAALYPETVGKFVLDAVVRFDVAYSITDNQSATIVDLELTLEAFFITCNAAGPACSFKGSSTSVKQLKDRFRAIDKKLKATPFQSPDSKPIDWSAFHRLLKAVILDSEVFFFLLADLLAEIEAGTPGSGTQTASSIINSPPPPLPPLDDSPPFDHVIAGICVDAADFPKKAKDFDKYLAAMQRASPNVGGILAQTNLYCTEWRVEPVNQFPKSKLSKSRLTRLSGKILYIGNSADALCPLDNAYYMRDKFFGDKATIIIDHAAGHTSGGSQGALSGLANFPSLGVFDIMFRFFNLDQTPAFDSVYLPDLPSFIGRGAGYVGLLPDGFGGVKNVPTYPVPGKTA